MCRYGAECRVDVACVQGTRIDYFRDSTVIKKSHMFFLLFVSRVG